MHVFTDKMCMGFSCIYPGCGGSPPGYEIVDTLQAEAHMRTRRKMSGIYAPETASVSAARWDVGKAFCVAKKHTWLIAKNTSHVF